MKNVIGSSSDSNLSITASRLRTILSAARGAFTALEMKESARSEPTRQVILHLHQDSTNLKLLFCCKKRNGKADMEFSSSTRVGD